MSPVFKFTASLVRDEIVLESANVASRSFVSWLRSDDLTSIEMLSYLCGELSHTPEALRPTPIQAGDSYSVFVRHNELFLQSKVDPLECFLLNRALAVAMMQELLRWARRADQSVFGFETERAVELAAGADAERIAEAWFENDATLFETRTE